MIPVNAIRNFALIGGIGFATEAVLLTSIIRLAGWPPWQARLPSFLAAVLVTWTLNRRYTFPGRGLDHASLDAIAYFCIQACGAAVNFLIFLACLAYFPKAHEVPLLALAVGAIGGFAFNFGTSKVLLYSRLSAKAYRR